MESDVTRFVVRKVAILGAGVMGAQIAAHFANAGVPVLLFDLASATKDRHAVATAAIERLLRIEPAPLVDAGCARLIEAANYEDDAHRLADCDLVIEAVVERMEIKRKVYVQLAPYLGAHAVFASNTSGIAIHTLAQAMPEVVRKRFCGIHFFNPPRYMPLVELIPGPQTDVRVLDALETFLTSVLGKSVIRARDTPNFIANRIGFFSLLATLFHAQRLGLGFDEVDALTGSALGRPRSATCRLMDLIGLDTVANVIRTMQDTLSDDPWHRHYTVPGWLSGLVAAGALGLKTRGGIFRKEDGAHQVFDPACGEYRSAAGLIAREVADVLRVGDEPERMRRLRISTHPQAQLLWSVQRDLFHYCAHHLEGIAHAARDVDLALRWGYGWKTGPFEQWQAAGWQETARAIEDDIEGGVSMCSSPLPDWVFIDENSARRGVHHGSLSFSASAMVGVARQPLPVHRRQLFPERLSGEQPAVKRSLFETDDVSLWLPEQAPDLPVLSFKTKMGAIGPGAIDGALEALARAEHSYDGLVIWQEDGPFSVGANLEFIHALVQRGDLPAIEDFLARFQTMTTRMSQAHVPVVAAVGGMALGGGCEVMMHCAGVAIALETTIGLVESKVGLIPGGGGCKAFAIRAARLASQAGVEDVIPFLRRPFEMLAAGQTARNAVEARRFGFARDADHVVFNPREVLYVALESARALARIGYRPSPAPAVAVAGRAGIDRLAEMLTMRRQADGASAHDERVGRALIHALCGGDVPCGFIADEQTLLAAERCAFMDLVATPETRMRIRHTLDTGKPLRN